MLRRVVILGAAVLLMIAIGGAVQFGYVSPTVALSIAPNAAALTSPTSTPVSSNQPSPPGGLGNSRDDLEKAYGSPTGLQGTMIAYREGKYAATYVDGRATSVLVSYPTAPPSLEASRAAMRSLLPTDSVFIGTLGAGPSRIADVYQSARLGARVAPPVAGTPRGQFVVVYETDRSGAVKDALLTVGPIPSPQ